MIVKNSRVFGAKYKIAYRATHKNTDTGKNYVIDIIRNSHKQVGKTLLFYFQQSRSPINRTIMLPQTPRGDGANHVVSTRQQRSYTLVAFRPFLRCILKLARRGTHAVVCLVRSIVKQPVSRDATRRSVPLAAFVANPRRESRVAVACCRARYR